MAKDRFFVVKPDHKLRELKGSSVNWESQELNMPELPEVFPNRGTVLGIKEERGKWALEDVDPKELTKQPVGTIIMSERRGGGGRQFFRVETEDIPKGSDLGKTAVELATQDGGVVAKESPASIDPNFPLVAIATGESELESMAFERLRQLGPGQDPQINWEAQQKLISSGGMGGRGDDIHFNIMRYNNHILMGWVGDGVHPSLRSPWLKTSATGRLSQTQTSLSIRQDATEDAVPEDVEKSFTEAMGKRNLEATIKLDKREKGNILEFKVKTGEGELSMADRRFALEIVSEFYEKGGLKANI